MDSSIETKAPHISSASPAADHDDPDKAGAIVDVTPGYTPEEEREVLRKIDCTVMPMMCLVFFLQYLDKQSLSYASVCCRLHCALHLP